MMFAVKIKNGPIGALRNNRWAACTAPSKAYTLLTGYLIRLLVTLRKHAHAIYRDFLLKNFSRKSVIFFLFLLQNIDCNLCSRRGGSNEYPQSMFWSKNKKNRYTPANPSFGI